MLHSSRSLQIIFRKVSKDTLGSESLWIFRKLKIILTKIICASKACFTGKKTKENKTIQWQKNLMGHISLFQNQWGWKTSLWKLKELFKLFRIAPFSFFLYCRYSLCFVDFSQTTVLLTIKPKSLASVDTTRYYGGKLWLAQIRKSINFSL